MLANETSSRPELLKASDAEIDDAVGYADPMVLRGLLYQLTGDPELEAIPLKTVSASYFSRRMMAGEAQVQLVRRKAAQFLKAYRDAGAGPIDVGPRERLPQSLGMIFGMELPEETLGFHLEELALDPWARSLEWRQPPSPDRLKGFRVAVIGAGMGGLNAALQLSRAGIPYTVIEKNHGVGGTWHENRYPGARVDSPSRAYTHIFGVDFPYPNPFCPWTENQKYFDWVADEFDLRKDIVFGTEVSSMAWDEAAGEWVIHMSGPGGERVMRANVVITAVGFLNRPKLPEIEGMETFLGEAWHTARWPEGKDLAGKRVAVIGTGCTGYQMIPELALEAAHVTVFQRTPQWLFPVPGYRAPFPPQVNWLDRNMPFYTNFMRFGSRSPDAFMNATTIDPDFEDPHACSAINKMARDNSIGFLNAKLKDDPALLAAMTPGHPVWSARPVAVDPDYCILDALQRDNVTLVTEGIARITPEGLVSADGRLHAVDVIVCATGFHATEYLFPMSITGRGGLTIDELWAEGGAKAYRGCMMPGFPNLWSIYGPNTNGALPPAGFHELITVHALQCVERLILEDRKSVEVRSEAYETFNQEQDEANSQRVWSDPRAQNYYWSRHGRSVTQSPYSAPDMWRLLRRPDFADLEIS
jgi:4-hydroxyacetophenone monooxygenase